MTPAQAAFLAKLVPNMRARGMTPLRLVTDEGQIRIVYKSPRMGELALAVMRDAEWGAEYSTCSIADWCRRGETTIETYAAA